MAKKIVKGVKKLAGGVVGGLLGKGGKKKAPEPVEGQPVVTPLGPDDKKRPRDFRSRMNSTVLSALTERLGDGKSGKLGG